MNIKRFNENWFTDKFKSDKDKARERMFRTQDLSLDKVKYKRVHSNNAMVIASVFPKESELRIKNNLIELEGYVINLSGGSAKDDDGYYYLFDKTSAKIIASQLNISWRNLPTF